MRVHSRSNIRGPDIMAAYMRGLGCPCIMQGFKYVVKGGRPASACPRLRVGGLAGRIFHRSDMILSLFGWGPCRQEKATARATKIKDAVKLLEAAGRPIPDGPTLFTKCNKPPPPPLEDHRGTLLGALWGDLLFRQWLSACIYGEKEFYLKRICETSGVAFYSGMALSRTPTVQMGGGRFLVRQYFWGFMTPVTKPICMFKSNA